MMFKDTADVNQRLGQQQYIASDEIATVVYLAQSLCKPVLAEGPAGVGKTELAKAWAAALGAPLVRLQCYEGLDESKALYEWEYAKQMLYTQLLRDTLRNVLGQSELDELLAHRERINQKLQQIIDEAELVVAFGGLPVKNTFVSPGGVTAHPMRANLHAAADNGVRFVSFSPLKDDF